ncbi:tRNA-guanine(15) transglycosylase, partial [Methanosarcinales archaeon]
MAAIFELSDKDVMGRIGKLRTAHGVIETPTVMPVIRPGVDASRMKKFGTEIIITNAYITYRSEDLKAQAIADGIHALTNWDGPIMT